MALTQQRNYKGFDINEYIKITWYEVIEWEKVNWVKIYNVELLINKYTDSTKQYDIEQISEKLQWLTETQLNLTNYYILLKTISWYENCVDL